MGVDLSRIEAWTREKLESEAFRRGIRSPEFRTRSELVRLILRDQYGERLAAGRELVALGARSVATARTALSNALGAALAVLPEPLDALAKLRGGRLPREPDRTPRPYSPPPAPPRPEPRAAETAVEVNAPVAPEPTPTRMPEPVPVETAVAVAPEPVMPPVTAVSAVEAAVAEPQALDLPADLPASDERLPLNDRPTVRPTGEPPAPEPAPAAQVNPFASPSSAPSGVPAGTFRPASGQADGTFRVAPLPPPPVFTRASQGSATGTRTFAEEPIRTVSMARLLAAQGHRERALAIYEELIAQNSEDASLQDEAQALRLGQPAQLPPLSFPPDAPADAVSAPVFPDDGDRLWCEGQPAQGLRLRWALSENGQQRARAVLGSEGELAIRVVSIAFDPVRVVRSEITEHGPIDASGEWTAPALNDSARCFAAVGLRQGQRFVAVVHARPG